MPKGNYFGVSSNRPKEFRNRLLPFKIRIPFAAEDIMKFNPLVLIEHEGSTTDTAKLMIGNQISDPRGKPITRASWNNSKNRYYKGQ